MSDEESGELESIRGLVAPEAELARGRADSFLGAPLGDSGVAVEAADDLAGEGDALEDGMEARRFIESFKVDPDEAEAGADAVLAVGGGGGAPKLGGGKLLSSSGSQTQHVSFPSDSRPYIPFKMELTSRYAVEASRFFFSTELPLGCEETVMGSGHLTQTGCPFSSVW